MPENLLIYIIVKKKSIGINWLIWSKIGYIRYEWVNISILQHLTFLIAPCSKILHFGTIILGINGLILSLMGYTRYEWVNMSINKT